MGTENPNRPNFPTRPSSSPFAAAPPTMRPFSSSGPVAEAQGPGFRPTPPNAPPSSVPFPVSRPMGGPEVPSFRPGPPSRYSDPSVPPPPTSNAPMGAVPFQRFPTPQFPSTGPAPPRAPPAGAPLAQPPMGQASSAPFSLRQQAPPVPMGPPPSSSPNMNVPPSLDSSFPASRPSLQPSFPGYPAKQSVPTSQAPPMQSAPFIASHGNYMPGAAPTSSPVIGQPGGYGPPPSVAPLGVQQPMSGPPLGSVQALAEDFSSLSLGSMPGSLDPGLDPKSLPRPLDGDVEPKSFAEMYPMNCNSRYLRLTTSAIPNSQSLASRWHLPLGAVVCPLAEAPEGVSISNFGLIGIFRYFMYHDYCFPNLKCSVCVLFL